MIITIINMSKIQILAKIDAFCVRFISGNQ